MKKYYLYIITDTKFDKLFIDITDDLLKKMFEIKSGSHNNDPVLESPLKLVYFEESRNVLEAIRLKKKIEKWDKVWKIILIEKFNPDWEDLSEDLILNENLTKMN